MKDDRSRKGSGTPTQIAKGAVDGIITAALTFLLTFAVFLLAYYCLIPMLSDLAGLIGPDAQNRLVGWLNRSGTLVYGFCGMVAIFPAMLIAIRFDRPCREVFLKETGGLIAPRTATRWYFRKYWPMELSRLITLCLAGLVWASMGMPLLAQTPVLAAYDLCYRYGGLLGLPISALWTALAQLAAVRLALNNWQADHFCPEE